MVRVISPPVGVLITRDRTAGRLQRSPKAEGQKMTTLIQAPAADSTASTLPKPTDTSAESPDAVAVVMDFVGATLAQLDQFLDCMRINSGGQGFPGSLFQWSRSTGDGVRVTEVWRSKRHFEMFLRDVLAPHLSEAGLPTPETTTYEVHSYLTQGPVDELRTQDDAPSNSHP